MSTELRQTNPSADTGGETLDNHDTKQDELIENYFCQLKSKNRFRQ